MDDSNILLALRTIQEAGARRLRRLRETPTFEGARKTLQEATRIEDKVEGILQCLEKNLPLLKDLVKLAPGEAVSAPSWELEDHRLTDIRVATGKDASLTHKFRAHLAYRDLALEYERWLAAHGRISRVEQLASQLTRSVEKKAGQITEFIREKNYPAVEARNAIKDGIKILVIAELSKCPGISVLLFLVHTRIHRLRYNEIENLVRRLLYAAQDESRGDRRALEKREELAGIATNGSHFTNRCQEIYGRTISQSDSPPSTPNGAQTDNRDVDFRSPGPQQSEQARPDVLPTPIRPTASLSYEICFSRNSIPYCRRPYGAPIFVQVMNGNIEGIRNLLVNSEATIWDCDPYGLGLLYVCSVRTECATANQNVNSTRLTTVGGF